MFEVMVVARMTGLSTGSNFLREARKQSFSMLFYAVLRLEKGQHVESFRAGGVQHGGPAPSSADCQAGSRLISSDFHRNLRL